MSERVQELRDAITMVIARAVRHDPAGMYADSDDIADADRVMALVAGLFTEAQVEALREATRNAIGQPFRELLSLHDTLAALRAVQATTDERKEGTP
ncbi:MAG TPA: hypothetical protein VKD22_10475 [Ramlibacter sp.]|nr:hypothetical protein [Ramlibacter sp.]